MNLLIQNAHVVTSSEDYFGDILCVGETIARIGKNLAPAGDVDVIDAEGLYVFPGFIDPHTHIYLPFMGTLAKDDYVSASQAALIGGTTTIFDMCIPARTQDPLEALELWQDQALGKSACDWSYHMAVTRYDKHVESQLREIVRDGIASFKVFLAYKGALDLADEELYQTLRLAKELGVITTAHCENADLVAERQQELLAAGHWEPRYHYESRPPAIEAEGVHHLASFAELLGAHVYIVHLSCAEALRCALEARDRGASIWIETLIQYLLLDKTYAERDGFEGAKYVMSPPLREKSNQAVLWHALQTGSIDTVATDHAPFDFQTQKTMGKADFTRIPNGIPALEERANLLFTYGVQTGKLDLRRFVEVTSTQAARIFGLYPRKGCIAPGSDADLVVFDPNYRSTISAATQKSKVDYSAFEGFEIQGRPRHVALRGKIVVRDGQFVGRLGGGQLLKREPTHF